MGLFSTLKTIYQIDKFIKQYDAAQRKAPELPKIDLENFMAWIRGNGLQKNYRFLVDFKFPPCILSSKKIKSSDRTNLLLACEDMSLPAKTIQTRTLRLNGLDEQRVHTIDYGGTQGFTLTFLVDPTHEVREFFETWMNSMVDQRTREIAEYNSYTTTLDLFFLRPNLPGESWAPITQNINAKPGSAAGRKLLERGVSALGNKIGQLEGQLREGITENRDKLLGKNLVAYNKVKGVIKPLLEDRIEKPSDVSVFWIGFNEIFPRSISGSMLSHSNTDIYKIVVEFAFKDYVIQSTIVEPGTFSGVTKFLRKLGIPTSKSDLARKGLGLV